MLIRSWLPYYNRASDRSLEPLRTPVNNAYYTAIILSVVTILGESQMKVTFGFIDHCNDFLIIRNTTYDNDQILEILDLDGA